MSKQEPFIGPRNAGAAERGAYQAKDFLMGEDVALMTAGLSIVIAMLGKLALNTETVQAGSLKKIVLNHVSSHTTQ